MTASLQLQALLSLKYFSNVIAYIVEGRGLIRALDGSVRSVGISALLRIMAIKVLVFLHCSGLWCKLFKEQLLYANLETLDC